tara:strand:+ start:394 stop:894 length:501 start_codon:yes stop_codon:yes gene_type:complete
MEQGQLIFVWLIASSISGAIGAIIGARIDKAQAGFWWGFFLGFIGWIILLLMPREVGSAPQTADRSDLGKLTFVDFKKSQKLENPSFSHKHKQEQQQIYGEYLKKVESEKTKEPLPTARLSVHKIAQSTVSPSIEERLARLKSITDSGIVSEEEASVRRREILAEL